MLKKPHFDDDYNMLPNREEKSMSKFEHLSDPEIWHSLKKGNDAAFIYLYDKYFNMLYGYGFQFSKDSEFVKDCIQDLFVEINNSRGRSGEVRAIKPYLMVSLKRKILYYQKRSRKVIYKDDLLRGYDFQMTFAHEDRIINQQFELEKKKKLNKALRKILTKRQREAIYYLYYERLSMDEVAGLMNIGRRSAQNLLYKAISMLKSNLLGLLLAIAMV